MEQKVSEERPMLRSRKRKRNIFCLVLIAAAVLVWGGVIRWNHMEARAHTEPSYKKEGIEHLLHKKAGSKKKEDQDKEDGAYLEEKDYELLFMQTGMGRVGVDALFAQGEQQKLKELQEIFFARVEVVCMPNTRITREERVAGKARAEIPCLEEGDILVTFNSHALTWRNGHVGLVVDAVNRLTLEASRLGTKSAVCSLDHWESYPSFVVLRLKRAPAKERAAVAAFAEKELVGIPYRLEAGILDRIVEKGRSLFKDKATETAQQKEAGVAVSGTHCAHLAWYVYRQFGYDIDSDGGLVVTPADLFSSPLFEVVQIYGMSAEDFS